MPRQLRDSVQRKAHRQCFTTRPHRKECAMSMQLFARGLMQNPNLISKGEDGWAPNVNATEGLHMAAQLFEYLWEKIFAWSDHSARDTIL